MNELDKAKQVAERVRQTYNCEAYATEIRRRNGSEYVVRAGAVPSDVILPAVIDGVAIWVSL